MESVVWYWSGVLNRTWNCGLWNPPLLKVTQSKQPSRVRSRAEFLEELLVPGFSPYWQVQSPNPPLFKELSHSWRWLNPNNLQEYGAERSSLKRCWHPGYSHCWVGQSQPSHSVGYSSKKYRSSNFFLNSSCASVKFSLLPIHSKTFVLLMKLFSLENISL